MFFAPTDDYFALKEQQKPPDWMTKENTIIREEMENSDCKKILFRSLAESEILNDYSVLRDDQI